MSQKGSSARFQSAPPVAGRRCHGCTRRHRRSGCRFNPRLPLLGGDAGVGVPRSRGINCFNPRLPLLGGDAYQDRRRSRQRRVSIHASRCWEAMRGAGISPPHPITRFNPRLPLLGGDATKTLGLVTPFVVVSIHASRCWEAMPQRAPARHRRTASFNPRLPLLGGDAKLQPEADKALLVSIHASRCWEAMLCGPRTTRNATTFQSTPPVAGRRCRDALDLQPQPMPFQSTPPVAGRRCPEKPPQNLCIMCFNPRLPLLGGDALKTMV